VRQEGSGRAGHERTQDGQAGLEADDDAAVRSPELLELAAVFGLRQDDCRPTHALLADTLQRAMRTPAAVMTIVATVPRSFLSQP
jgi:hypothetical protein